MTLSTNELSGLRIAFLAGTLGQGGAERQLFYILKTLREQGCHPLLFTLTKNEFWEQSIRELGIPVTWIGAHPSPLLRLWTFFNISRTLNVGIIQSQHFYTNIYTAIVGKVTGKLDIGAIRNDVISEVESNGKFFGPLCLILPRLLAANSQSAMRRAVSKGVPKKKLLYLPNVIDCDLFAPTIQPADQTITFLTIGRLTRQKNQQLFLHALAKLSSLSGKNIRGVIAGSGEEKNALERTAHELGLFPNIISFVDNVANPVTYYHAATAFVLTSDWEGTPNVILEAMACGLPVIATAAGEIPALIEDERTGLLVNPGDLNMLVEKMKRVIESPVLRSSLGKNARELIVRKRSLSRLPNMLQDFYARIK